MGNALKHKSDNQPASSIIVGPMQGSYTGGAPGTPTYAWQFVAPSSPGSVFLNPGNSSSQLVQFPSVAAGATVDQGVRVTVTDALGNASTQDAIATAVHDTLA